MKIGILGGTFDPPHCGHLALAEAATRQLGLEEVIFVPTFANPIKLETAASPPPDRFNMVKLLIEGRAGMSVSDIEISRAEPSYTIDTMTTLHLANPHEYWLLVGADVAASLTNWKQPDKLLRLCRIGVVARQIHGRTFYLHKLPAEWRSKIDEIDFTPMRISSTLIRERIKDGFPVSTREIPQNVLNYIRRKNLYKETH